MRRTGKIPAGVRFAVPVLLCCGLTLLPATGRAMGLDFGTGGGVTPPPVEAPEPTLVLTPGPLEAPLRVAVVRGPGRGSHLLVTDYAANAIYRAPLEAPDAVTRLFAGEGRVLSVAGDGKRIFLGDKERRCVELRRADGKLQKTLAAPVLPYDLAIDHARRQLVILDGLANNVRFLRFNGKPERVLAGFGDLVNPRALAVDGAAGLVAIGDLGDPQAGILPSIQLYRYSGELLWKQTGGFSAPQGLTLAGERLYVVDALLGQVLVLDVTNGSRLGVLGRFGTGDGQLFMPADVVAAPDGATLFIANYRLGRVTPLAVDRP